MKKRFIPSVSLATFLLAVIIFILAGSALGELSGSIEASVNNNVTAAYVGDTVTVNFKINSNMNFYSEGSFTLSEGFTLKGNPTNVAGYGPKGFYTMECQSGHTISVTLDIVKSGLQEVKINLKLTDESGKTEVALQKSVSVYIYTDEDIREQEEERKRAEEEARSKAAEEEEKRRIAAEASAEASREAAREAERIRKEMEEQARIRASEEEEENRRIAESIAIAESKRKEEEELLESQRESEAIRQSIEERESLIEESLRQSEEEVERTRPVFEGDITFFPIERNGRRFLFASYDTNIELPFGFTKTSFLINGMKAFAGEKPSFRENTYLVYGRYEDEEEAEFWYYNALENFLIRRSELEDESTYPETEDEKSTEAPTEPTEKSSAENTVTQEPYTKETETSKEENEESSLVSKLLFMILLICSFVIGTAVTAILFVAFRKPAPQSERYTEPEEEDSEFRKSPEKKIKGFVGPATIKKEETDYTEDTDDETTELYVPEASKSLPETEYKKEQEDKGNTVLPYNPSEHFGKTVVIKQGSASVLKKVEHPVISDPSEEIELLDLNENTKNTDETRPV